MGRSYRYKIPIRRGEQTRKGDVWGTRNRLLSEVGDEEPV
jgi:hypothetical protein